MKSTNLGVATLTLLGASVSASFAQSDLSLNFNSLSGSQMVFQSSSFNFSPASPGLGIGPGGSVPDQWFISSETGSAATQSAVGDVGGFAGGPFTYGAISSPDGGFTQTATVNFNPLNPDYLFISDGSGYLHGTVNFIDITTIGQVGGEINDEVLVNLTNVGYSGADPDLGFLTANQPGELDMTFQFVGDGLNLTQLSDGNSHASTSYSGSISVSAVPEPTSLAMSLLGGLGAFGLALRRRI